MTRRTLPEIVRASGEDRLEGRGLEEAIRDGELAVLSYLEGIRGTISPTGGGIGGLEEEEEREEETEIEASIYIIITLLLYYIYRGIYRHDIRPQTLTNIHYPLSTNH